MHPAALQSAHDCRNICCVSPDCTILCAGLPQTACPPSHGHARAPQAGWVPAAYWPCQSSTGRLGACCFVDSKTLQPCKAHMDHPTAAACHTTHRQCLYFNTPLSLLAHGSHPHQQPPSPSLPELRRVPLTSPQQHLRPGPPNGHAWLHRVAGSLLLCQ
jgi:hypothetical protein